MSAKAKLIRKAAAKGLLCLNTPAQDRIYTNRFRSLPEWLASGASALPAIVIYTINETVEISVDAPKEYRRRMEMAIEIVVSRGEAKHPGADDRLDDIAELVEQWVFRNPALGLTEHDDVTFGDHPSSLIRDENAPINEGGSDIAAKRLVFEVTYYQDAPEGDVDALPPAKSIEADWDLGPTPDKRLEARDLVNVGAGE